MNHVFIGFLRDIGVVQFYVGKIPLWPQRNAYNGLFRLIAEKPLLDNFAVFFEGNVDSLYVSVKQRKP